MTRITMLGDKVVFVGPTIAGSELECCDGCEPEEPCCPCEGPPPESCALQSITVALDFDEFGTCLPQGLAVQFSITADDNDWLGAWSKTYTAQAGDGQLTVEAALNCGLIGAQQCYHVLLNFVVSDCTICNTTVLGTYVILLNGVTGEDDVCCPVGRTRAIPFADFCTDISGSVSVTCVY